MYEIPKKCNKINGPSITCGNIWHVNISKCAYSGAKLHLGGAPGAKL